MTKDGVEAGGTQATVSREGPSRIATAFVSPSREGRAASVFCEKSAASENGKAVKGPTTKARATSAGGRPTKTEI